MKRSLFRFKWVSSERDKAFGVMFRVFGIDFALVLMGYVSDWRVIDLRIPANYGIYFQLLFVFASFGLLRDDVIYERDF